MTDRVRTLTVILDRDMRTDDVQAVVDAIAMLKHVAAVKLGPVDHAAVYAAEFQSAMKLREEILAVLDKRLK